MSTLVTLRVPNDLLEQIDGTAKLEGMSRSQVMISLMRDQDPRPTKTEAEAIKKVAERVRTEKQPEPKAPKQPERPKAEVVRQCPRCGDRDKVISWGSMDRCTRCGMNF